MRAAFRNAGLSAILLLAPAAALGSWRWPAGVAFVAASAVLQLTSNLALATWRPAHFWIRQQNVVATKDGGQPHLDAIGSAILVCFAFAWMAFIPFDVFRLPEDETLAGPEMVERDGWNGHAKFRHRLGGCRQQNLHGFCLCFLLVGQRSSQTDRAEPGCRAKYIAARS